MKRFIEGLLENFSYQPPQWLRRLLAYSLATTIGRSVMEFFGLRKGDPKKFYSLSGVSILLAVILVGVGIYGYQGWQA